MVRMVRLLLMLTHARLDEVLLLLWLFNNSRLSVSTLSRPKLVCKFASLHNNPFPEFQFFPAFVKLQMVSGGVHNKVRMLTTGYTPAANIGYQAPACRPWRQGGE